MYLVDLIQGTNENHVSDSSWKNFKKLLIGRYRIGRWQNDDFDLPFGEVSQRIDKSIVYNVRNRRSRRRLLRNKAATLNDRATSFS